MRIIGEAQQQWAPLRRKYNLFAHRQSYRSGATSSAPQYSPADQPLSNSQQLDLTPYNHEARFDQFAYVDEPFLSWDFSLLSNEGGLIGSVNRNFSGFGREIFTDTGVYALRMDSVGLAQEPTHLISQTGQQSVGFQNPNDPGMTLDQRAVMLATAVSIDFDYFSRKSGSGTGFMPLWFPGMGGGGAAAEGAEAEAGAGAIEGSGSSAGGMVKGDSGGWTEGAVTGAGTMAGYEAMQRGTGRGGDDASPQAGQQDANQPGYGQDQQQQPGQIGQNEDIWGNNDDPWGGKGGGDGGGDGGDGGGDWGDWF